MFKTFNKRILCLTRKYSNGNCWDQVYFVHPSTDISVDISTDSRPMYRPIYRPTVDRYVGRHIYWHSADISTTVVLDGLFNLWLSCIASQAWQKLVEFKTTYWVSVWYVKLTNFYVRLENRYVRLENHWKRNWNYYARIKTVMRDHNYPPRMKNC